MLNNTKAGGNFSHTGNVSTNVPTTHTNKDCTREGCYEEIKKERKRTHFTVFAAITHHQHLSLNQYYPPSTCDQFRDTNQYSAKYISALQYQQGYA
jgi:hypothetical protein